MAALLVPKSQMPFFLRLQIYLTRFQTQEIRRQLLPVSMGAFL
jgi:hypothetical protein